jgi:methionyl-tRNA synthetase
LAKRFPHEVAAHFQADFEKRARGSYVNRMLVGPDFAFAVPVLDQIRKSWADYDAKLAEVCTVSLNVFRLLTLYLKPVIPELARAVEQFLAIEPLK